VERIRVHGLDIAYERATLILADTYAGWKGSLPADELRTRVEGA
jgi:hypothetical protein